MEVIAVKTRVARVGEDLHHFVVSAIKGAGVELWNGDVIAVASKFVSTFTRVIVDYSKVKPSEEAEEIARRYGIDPGFAEFIATAHALLNLLSTSAGPSGRKPWRPQGTRPQSPSLMELYRGSHAESPA